MILRQLVKPSVSKYGGRFLSTKLSAGLVPRYVEKNHIDLGRFEIPSGGYSSFNDFFTRRMKPGFLSIAKSELISPCDGLLTVFNIDETSNFRIKNSYYSLARLLRDDALAEKFKNGTAFIFRLTPSHYHRYNFCANGNVSLRKVINGKLHCVRPIALEQLPVFIENSREYITIESTVGNIVQMEVGALLVGKISNQKGLVAGSKAAATEEKGYFEFGGSTIIVLTDQKTVLNEAISKRAKNEEGEIPVRIGESLI